MAKISLKAARVNCGLTQAQMAEKLGVSKESIAKWESGETEIRPMLLYAYCHVTGFKESDFSLPTKSE